MGTRVVVLQLRPAMGRLRAGRARSVVRWVRGAIVAALVVFGVCAALAFEMYLVWWATQPQQRIRCAEPQNCRESFGGPARGSEP